MSERDDGLLHPRFGWLALFQACVITLVVLMARETHALSAAPLLEDQLGQLSEGSDPSAARPWGHRGWLAALVAMLGALLLILPVAWAYVATRLRREVDSSVVTTIVVLPIAVAAILVIVQDSLAVAFSLAGIAGLVRFRNALEDTRDAMYVVIAIAVGLGAGVGMLEASAALTALYVLSVVALWKWHTSQPVIADIALGERTVPRGQTVLEALSKEGERHPEPTVEWFEAAEAVPVGNGSAQEKARPDKRDGMLRVQVADDIPTRRTIEEVLASRTKRWALDTEAPVDGLPALTYCVRLKKRTSPDALMQALRERLGDTVSEYTPMRPEQVGNRDSAT